MEVRAGNPVRPMLAQRLSEPDEILAKLGGRARPSTSTTASGSRPTAHRMASWSCTPAWTGSRPSSPSWWSLGEALGPREAILEGEVVAFDPASGELRPFQDVMFRRRKYGITEAVRDFPVSLFCFELLQLRRRRRPDPPAVPGAALAPGRGRHRVGAGPAGHRRADRRRPGAGAGVRAGRGRGLRRADLQVA